MRSFDQALYDLYRAGKITEEEAVSQADSENEVRLMIKLGRTADPGRLAATLDGVGLEKSEDHTGMIG